MSLAWANWIHLRSVDITEVKWPTLAGAAALMTSASAAANSASFCQDETLMPRAIRSTKCEMGSIKKLSEFPLLLTMARLHAPLLHTHQRWHKISRFSPRQQYTGLLRRCLGLRPRTPGSTRHRRGGSFFHHTSHGSCLMNASPDWAHVIQRLHSQYIVPSNSGMILQLAKTSMTVRPEKLDIKRSGELKPFQPSQNPISHVASCKVRQALVHRRQKKVRMQLVYGESRAQAAFYNLTCSRLK